MSEILHGSTVIQCPCCGESWNDDNYSYTAKLTELETRCRVLSAKLEKARYLMIDEIESRWQKEDCSLMVSARNTIFEIEAYDASINAITIDSLKGGEVG